MGKAVPFFEMFSCCRDDASIAGFLEPAKVISAVVDDKRTGMRVSVEFPERPAPFVLSLAESEIASEFGLESVVITPSYPPPEPAVKAAPKKKAKTVLYGREIRGNVIPVGEIEQDSGRVTIEGEVFAHEVRTVRNGNAKIVDFCVTDGTGSVRVSKFIREDKDNEGLLKIKDGIYIKVQGHISYNRYHGDLNLEPSAAEFAEKPCRKDTAEVKRVELHMHSKMSALDAVTDVDEIVKTAAKWGHKAIAITDHGVCQAFPNIASAGKNNGIKILYGVEAYFINDYDDRVVVTGDCRENLDGEFVAFDVETTGLNMFTDRITEIGAVRISGGEVLDRFTSFVNPRMHIPYEVTQLTGINDSDVADAPSEGEALREFLKFIGDCPVIAHNADFDTGFITEACKRQGLAFNNCSIDTLTMAQNLIPDKKKYTLEYTAGYLGVREARYHRAADDADTTAQIAIKLFKKLRETGVNTVAEINEAMLPVRVSKGFDRRSPKHIILLVKEQQGIKNLYKMVSLSHLQYFKKHPIIPKSLLMQYKDGLIIGSACENSELFKAVTGKKSDRELLRLSELYDYFEIQPIANNRFMLDNGTAADEEELREFNRRMVNLGKLAGKPVVATCDVHFTEPEHEIYRRILVANKFSDADKPLPLYFRTTDEMLEEFSYLGEETAFEVVVTNTNLIADSCGDVSPLPKDLFIPEVENSARDFRDLVNRKMTRLYGENPPDIVKKRVETEMEDIIGRGYDSIYMTAQKLIAKSIETGYLVGSRGSVGSSVAAYMADITEVNALPPHYRCPNCKHSDFEAGDGFGSGMDLPDKTCPECGTLYKKDGFDIPFETFLGFGGDKVPDIDLNFSGEYQSLAHAHTVELFGKDQVFRAGTIGGIAEKTAFGYVLKYLEERGMKVSKAEETRLAAGLTGVRRTTGQHPGGLVVVPRGMEIYDFCPVQRPADSTESDVITTHFEYHSMESNLLKLDLLGHDAPSTLRMLQDLTGVDPVAIPLDDPETMSIFSSPKVLGLPDDDPIIGKTGTIAIPEHGTKFTREMLCDVKPETFSALIRISGFSHGTDVWLGNAKDLIMGKTASINEVIGCRDDIMNYLMSAGMEAKLAFAIMESVRKGRALKPEWEKEMRGLKVPEWYIESCNKIKYLFPKAHAAAYVIMAFRIAWFKVHRPIEFYSAYFSLRAPAFDFEAMTGGIDRVRVKMRELEVKPDIKPQERDLVTALEVCYEFYKRGFEFGGISLERSDAVNFLIDGNALIPPFTAISGLGETAARDLAAARDAGGFLSVDELASMCPKVSKTHVEQLKKAGAFGDLPDSAQLSFF